jgi:transposase InsO family protein
MYSCPPDQAILAANETPFAVDGCSDILTTLYDTATQLTYTRPVTYIIVPQLGDALLLGRHAMHRVIGQLDVNNSQAIFDPTATPDASAPLPIHESLLTTTRGTVIPAGHTAVLRVTYDPIMDTQADGCDILCEPRAVHNKAGNLIPIDFTPHLISARPDGLRTTHTISITNTGPTVLSLPRLMSLGTASHVYAPPPPLAPTPPTTRASVNAVHVVQEAKEPSADADSDSDTETYRYKPEPLTSDEEDQWDHNVLAIGNPFVNLGHLKEAATTAGYKLDDKQLEDLAVLEYDKYYHHTVRDRRRLRRELQKRKMEGEKEKVGAEQASSGAAPDPNLPFLDRVGQDPKQPFAPGGEINLPAPLCSTGRPRPAGPNDSLTRKRDNIAAELAIRADWYHAGYRDGYQARHATPAGPVAYVNAIGTQRPSDQAAHAAGFQAGAEVTPDEETQFFSEFDANKALTPAQSLDLKTMLLRNREVFDKIRLGDVAPRAVGVEFAIHTGDAVPLKQAPYRHSPANEAVIQKEVDNLLTHGLIVPSFSPWGSPVLLVKKKDGSQRMCIDYRKLNALTKKDAYPLPLIEDCLERCKDAKFMTIIDLADAYHHIPMEPASEAATAFVVKNGLYHWKVMPFGATGCPGAFQRYVDKVLRGLVGDCCTAYFDDIVVYNDGPFEQHVKDLERVLVRLREHHLRAKLKKCHFGYDEIVFVGHLVKNGTIRPDPSKVDAIKQIPIPADVTQLKSFLGLVNYYRKFIPHFAKTALPLYALTKKGVVYDWSGDADAAFNQLKAALVSADCLFAPDFKKQFILQTDACNTGLGAVLTQTFDGIEHPVAYISRQLKPAETRYSATEQEALAVVWGIKEFEHFLIDKPFIVVTDHHALQWLPTKKSPNKRLARWALLLSEFSFEVQYRKGKDNANADGLSRNPISSPHSNDDDDDMKDGAAAVAVRSTPHHSASDADSSNAIFHAATPPASDQPPSRHQLIYARRIILQPPAATPTGHRVHPSRAHLVLATHSAASAGIKKKVEREQDDFILVEQNLKPLVDAQRCDPKLHDLLRYLEHKEIPASYTPLARTTLIRKASRYIIEPESKALYCIRPPESAGRFPFMPFQRRLVLPAQYQPQILGVYHDSPFGGHLGISKTYRRVALRYEWEGMYQDIASYIARCVECLRSKAVNRLPNRSQPRMQPPSYPFEIVAMDHTGPILESWGFVYILVIVCMFTGWAITVPTRDTLAVTTTRVFLDRVICQHGCPRRILTDNAFDNETTQDFLRTFNMKHILISPHHPQTNGMVERLNGTLKKILRSFGEAFLDDWARYLQACTFAYNTSPKERDGLSPFFALYGREAHLPGELFLGLDHYDYKTNKITEYVYDIRKRLQNAHDYMRVRLDAAALQNTEHQKRLASYPIHRIGDIVWLRSGLLSRGKQPLFDKRYDGPWVIRARVGQVNYEISRPDHMTHTELVHVDNIKKSQSASTEIGSEQEPVPHPPQEGVGLDGVPEAIPPLDRVTPSAAPDAAASSASSSSTADATDESAQQHRRSRRDRRAHLAEQPAPTTDEQMSDVAADQLLPSPLPPPVADPHPEAPSTHPMLTRARKYGWRANMNEKLQEQLGLMHQFTNRHRRDRVASRHPANFTVRMTQIIDTAGAALKKKVVS